MTTITLTPSGGDDTTQIMNALASFNSGVSELVLNGAFLAPNGITESVPGLAVRGIGHPCNGPGVGGTMGSSVKTTNGGVWVWKHIPPAAGNEYRGPSFSTLTFAGNAGTLGGLLLQTCYGIVNNCASANNLNGIGFGTQYPTGGDDASWNTFNDCLSQDNVTGFQIGTPNQTGAASAQLVSPYAIQTSANNMRHRGTGVVFHDNNSSLMGGKLESCATGLLVKTMGVVVIGTRFEDNSLDVDLYRDAGTNGTRNLLIVPTSKVRVGPYNVNDMVIGGDWQGPIQNQGTDTVVLSDY